MNVPLLRSTEKTFEPTNLLPLLCSSILYIRACFLLIISCQSEKGLSQWYKTIDICLCVTSWLIGWDMWPESNHRQRNLKLVYMKQIPLTLICYHVWFAHLKLNKASVVGSGRSMLCTANIPRSNKNWYWKHHDKCKGWMMVRHWTNKRYLVHTARLWGVYSESFEGDCFFLYIHFSDTFSSSWYF